MTRTYDVVVLGSGAAGLTAAFVAASKGLAVGLFEKSGELGGTSAWSGGQVWVPNNSQQADVGAEDSDDEAFTYMMSLSRGLLDPAIVRQYIETGPRMLDFLNEHADAGFHVVPGYPDYHPNNPGGKPGGGRTLEVPLFPFSRLGDWAAKVTDSPYLPKYLELAETPMGSAVPAVLDPAEIERRSRDDERGMGQALIGRLLLAAMNAGVDISTSHRAKELTVDDGKIVGVVCDTADGEVRIQAREAVVLATGGFEWNPDLKKTYLRGPLTLPVTMPTCEGDGLRIAMQVGADLQNMREAWWTPVAELPEGINRMNRVMVNADRTRPRSIMVNREGRRFTNEAASYNAVGGAFHQEDVTSFDYVNLPAWLIFDHEHATRYGSVSQPYSENMPWLTKGKTLEELGEKTGIPSDQLLETVEHFNANVDEGVDPDFHRGESAHDLWWGDPYAKGRIEGTLGRIDRGPYYALKLDIGSLGTKGGPKIDANARVIGLDGQPIEGLYAAGNVSSPMGMSYAGAGATLGCCLVFGFLAAENIVERARSEPREETLWKVVG